MEIVPEASGAYPLVYLQVISKNDNSKIPVVGDVWLHNKRKTEGVRRGVSVDLLYTIKEKYPEATIFAFLLQDNFANTAVPVLTDYFQEVMDGVNDRCAWYHGPGKQSCLKRL